MTALLSGIVIVFFICHSTKIITHTYEAYQVSPVLVLYLGDYLTFVGQSKKVDDCFVFCKNVIFRVLYWGTRANMKKLIRKKVLELNSILVQTPKMLQKWIFNLFAIDQKCGSVFRGLLVILEWILCYFNHTTFKGLQLPFQNGKATFCSLKIVAAMTKIARVPFSMQKFF